MPEKDPTNWTIATWMLAIGMAFGGSIVSFYQRYKQRHRKSFTALELLGEIATSAFVGVGAFMLLDSLGQSAGLCAAGAGIGGHMGTRLLFFTETFIIKKIKDDDDESKTK